MKGCCRTTHTHTHTYTHIYIYITTVYSCHNLTWYVCDRPNAIYFGDFSISVIELLYNNKGIYMLFMYI